MRMRKKKNGEKRIAACAEYLVTEPIASFSELFGNEREVHVEIGCGKGNFVCGMAEKYPDVNFLAVEKVSDVCCIALEKAKAALEAREGDNIRFYIGDANSLCELIPPHSVDCIYLNFSDPWPKKGHTKRRLTYRGFLEIYEKLLKEGGVLKLKTDNVGLFDFSLEEFEAFGLEFLMQTRDLHNSEYAEGNVMTEYEKNFSEKGMSINSAHVRFNKRESN